jgi:DNA-binding NarL/FixJ family response regulator
MVRNVMEPTTIIESAFVRVVIVDDAPRVRVRLKALLYADAPYAEVVGEAGEARTAIRRILDRSPDVVILDLQLEGASGIEVLRAITCGPSARRYHADESARARISNYLPGGRCRIFSR